MKNLFDFFIRHSAWVVATIYVVLSLLMLIKDNPYQQSIYLTSANAVSSTVYGGISSVTDYFHLKGINDELQQRNALLEMQLVDLRAQLADAKMQLPDTTLNSNLQHFDFVVAHVISNSIAQTNNYITINRGAADGIKAEMGVVDHTGVVGIVNVVGKHSARIISLLNPYMKLSCKLKNSEYFGSMVWDTGDPRYATLEELPKHLHYAVGDTVVTSGYSTVFPEGIIVGTIEGRARNLSDSFVSLKVKLSTNFSQLSTVRVITNDMSEELHLLQESDAQGLGGSANRKEEGAK